ncbi:TPA_inf: ORF1+2p [Festuca pratensis amalgavirus 2]|uniref:ORF1+2p n=1 Tax=Festuca pratensis amalgavirus 2 TaxID=2069325 RepID=UPI000DC1DB72|nr:ORF1+2p [Festuca pratensis amalgavirus 2]DAB41687.1 TPA_inf: ORF1+2p [Festuca pratensis amalgavirus 2]
MSVDPLRFLEDAATAQAADAIKLRPLMLELSGSKVLAKECDIEHLLNAGFTVDDVEKLSKSLKPLIDQGVFDDAWTMAKGSGIILSAQEMTFPDLFMFRRWLTTPQGAQALSLVQARRKMTKAGKKVLGHQDVALLRLLQHYEDDARRELDAKRVETEAAVAQLQAEIDKLKKKYAKAEKKQKRDFPLIANYVPLTDNEVRNQAWDMYCQQCINEGSVPMGRTSTNLKIVGDKFRDHIVQAHKLTYCQQPDHTDALIEFGKQKILRCQEAGSGKLESSFVTYSLSSIQRMLLRYPLAQRKQMMEWIPMGVVPTRPSLTRTQMLSQLPTNPLLLKPRVLGARPGPPLPKAVEAISGNSLLSTPNRRIQIHRRSGQPGQAGIPTARSRWEAGVRHIIGGGELLEWRVDNNKYRGGGNLHDALLLIGSADDVTPYTALSSLLSVEEARRVLLLPDGLAVPDGKACCVMKQFNDDATAGPLLRAFGVKGKYGLKAAIEQFVWGLYDRVGSEDLKPRQLPGLLARVGYRTKLLDMEKALKKIQAVEPLGRAVMMLDATEQCFSSPLFNAISEAVTELHSNPRSGWRNYLVRASSAWADLWDELKSCGTIVELDWSKFDRDRPAEDIQFFVDVIISCFRPKNSRERRLLAGYRKMMENALVHRVMMLDDGSFFTLEGMVPSGSLWTGICDTALNIMYITSALRKLGFDDSTFSPKCAGDDNLTCFQRRQGLDVMERLRTTLNEMFRANIDKKDFIVHYPPYAVTTVQACFEPGTDLSKGTSRMMDKAEWVPFTGPCPIDQAAGRSHRWKYVFTNKPKFLANFFLPDGKPIRPAHDNLEKLLWPEGIHESIEDYMAAVLSMVVDNPFNHHNVNHMMHRYLIAQQIQKQSIFIDPAVVMELAKTRPKHGEAVPFPEIAYYRKCEGYVDIEREPEFQEFFKSFREFISSVSTLYARRSEGGIDAWRFMDIIRGQHSIGAGQFGNSVHEWCRFLGEHPLTRSLRKARRFRPMKEAVVADPETLGKVEKAFTWVLDLCEANDPMTPLFYASAVSDILSSNVSAP